MSKFVTRSYNLKQWPDGLAEMKKTAKIDICKLAAFISISPSLTIEQRYENGRVELEFFYSPCCRERIRMLFILPHDQRIYTCRHAAD